MASCGHVFVQDGGLLDIKLGEELVVHLILAHLAEQCDDLHVCVPLTSQMIG